MIVWRVLPVDLAAARDAAGGPLWFPREHQGAAPHDNPAAYGCLYVAEAPVSAVAEALAPFRGRGALTARVLERAGRELSLVTIGLRDPDGLLDLDEPATLVTEGLRPSQGGHAHAHDGRSATRCASSNATAKRRGCAGGRPSRRRG